MATASEVDRAVVGTGSKKADPVDTLRSPSAPAEASGAPGEAGDRLAPELGARSSTRIATDGLAARGQCLLPPELTTYLGQACTPELSARVERHVASCDRCQNWLRHIDDEIPAYVEGQCSEEELSCIDAHLDICEDCRELLHHALQALVSSAPGEGVEIDDWITTFASGSVVNSRYLIRRFAGRGGMGEVYEAFDQLMGRRIALKTLLCTAIDRPRAVRRLKEEVLNAQRVGHPHVCRINELQEHHDSVLGSPLPFFTMEFVDGERLGHRLRQGALPLEDVRTIALQLLGGLTAAHARGVLHLDLKSDNIMLRRGSPGPDVVIMDFGLSRVLGHESRLRTSERHQLAGTLPYMPLEQLECRDALGPAADVYAFGVVLYEMLTQGFPFSGDSLGALLLKQLNERPDPPSRRVPGLSPGIDQFVLKCLNKSASLRYADAGQALTALEALGPWSIPAPAPRRVWRRIVPLACVVVIGSAAAALQTWRSGWARPGGSSLSAVPRGTGEVVEQVVQKVEPNSELPPPATPVAPEPPAPAPAVSSPASRPEPNGPESAAVGGESTQPKTRSRFPHADAPPTASSSETAPASASSGVPSAPGAQGRELSSPETATGWKPAKVPKRLITEAAATGDGGTE